MGAGAPRTASWESGARVPLCAVVTATETEGGERARDGAQCVGGGILSSRTHVVHPMLTRADTGGGWALGIAPRVDPRSSPHQEEKVFSLFPFFLPPRPGPQPPAIFLFLCVCFFGSGVSVRGWAPTKLPCLSFPAHVREGLVLHTPNRVLPVQPGSIALRTRWTSYPAALRGGGDPTSPGAVCACTGPPRL